MRDDTISRAAAVKTVKKHYRGIDNDLLEVIAYEIEALPSAQPQSTMGQVTDAVQSTKDCISRQAVLDANTRAVER